MQKYPELFSTKARVDSFIAIGLLTTQSDLIPSLSSLYRRLAYAENSVRSYVRALANGGWVSFVRAPSGDKRSIGLRLEAPIIRAYEEYFSLLEAIALQSPAVPVSDVLENEDAAERDTAMRISA